MAASKVFPHNLRHLFARCFYEKEHDLARLAARLAEPGEFTKRAFLNGRIDLSQAEAVIDVINAKNEYALQSSVSQLRGSVSKEIHEIRDQIIQLIREGDGRDGRKLFDFIMVTKYLERIGDHATNIAEWVEFAITGVHKDSAVMH